MYSFLIVAFSGIDLAPLAEATCFDLILFRNLVDFSIASLAFAITFSNEVRLCQKRYTYRNTSEGGVKQMLEERIRQCKSAGVNKISYKIRTGKIVNEIAHQSEEMDFDLIIMASSRTTNL
jgi:nucleotide-binding universal stress UspA family protein